IRVSRRRAPPPIFVLRCPSSSISRPTCPARSAAPRSHATRRTSTSATRTSCSTTPSSSSAKRSTASTGRYRSISTLPAGASRRGRPSAAATPTEARAAAPLRSRAMLLAVDVGNTQTVFGLYEDGRLREHWRVATEANRTGDELGALVGRFIGLEAVDGVCLASTVPALIREYELFAERWAKAALLVLGPGVSTGISIRYDDPREVGPDRIANAVAAKERYGAPCIVVDFGTSTNFDVVSTEGEDGGGRLAP